MSYVGRGALMDIKGGQEQAGCFHNSGFQARAEDQPSHLPHPTSCTAELGNVSNADWGPGGFAAGERGMGGATRGTTHEDQEAAGVAEEL